MSISSPSASNSRGRPLSAKTLAIREAVINLTHRYELMTVRGVEIVAALNADPTLGYHQIAKQMGKGRTWVGDLVRWNTSGRGHDKFQPTPFVGREEGGTRNLRGAKKLLREAPPEQIAEMLDSPEIRANVSKALDSHYRERAAAASEKRRERRVEDRGGEEAHAEHEHRQRLAELVNVMRGAVSALRFAASQAKGLDLEADDTGAADELAELVEEIVGFGGMLKEYLDGRSITDDDIAELIGGR
jgi:hypothetical protein